MWSRREVIDYALQRRARLEALRRPSRALDSNEYEPEPLLLRAAMHHGRGVDDECPFCGAARMVHLHYAFGEQLGQYSGRIKTPEELVEMQNEFGEFKVCVVEVCVDCGWNFMITSYLLGDGRRRRPPRRQRTVEDIYG